MNTELLNSVAQITIFGINLAIVGAIALFVIMVTTGMNLRVENFSPIVNTPKPIYFGLVAQMIILPLVALALIFLFQPPTYIAIGLILLSCCPGGATSNFFTLLAKGNIATSICLTFFSGVISVFSIPYIMNFALGFYSESANTVSLPILESMVRIFIMVVLPVIIGMSVRAKLPKIAKSIEPVATKLSFLLVVATMMIVLYHVWKLIPQMLAKAGVITLTLNVIMMAIGYIGAMFLKLDEQNARCISIEIGVQNYLLSVVLALTMLKEPLYALVPLIYLFVMYTTVFSFIAYCRLNRQSNIAV